MHILVSNDDGYQAPGLAALAAALRPLSKHITVIAPDRNCSASSNSLTLNNPIRVFTAENGFLYVNGTPTDCVHLAITGLLETPPDMVVSGINAGANLGDDVLYSGTVAAAMEGRFLGAPAIAISSVGREAQHYATAAKVAQALLTRLQKHPLPDDVLLNVNVPDIGWEQLAGWQITRLGNRHRSEPVIKDKDPKGGEIYWIGPPGAEQDAGPGTDFYAINNRYVSVTPIKIDLTRYDIFDALERWLNK